MILTILQALISIPKIGDLLFKIWALFKNLDYEKAKAKVEEAKIQNKTAKTDEERKAAADAWYKALYNK